MLPLSLCVVDVVVVFVVKVVVVTIKVLKIGANVRGPALRISDNFYDEN